MRRSPIRRGWRRRAGLVPLVVAVSVVGGAVGWMQVSQVSPPTAEASATGHGERGASSGAAPAPANGIPPLGVYTGPGQKAAAEQVASELSGRVGYALDFLSGSSWTALTDPSWLADAWAGSSFDMVLAVPLLPVSGATLAKGAAGLYDAWFTLLAQRLVDDGFASAVLMIGYQPDDAGHTWYVDSAQAARNYVAYWDRIRAAMSSVAGQHFVFEWDAGDAGNSPISPAQMYPGDSAVDVVATDAFESWASTPAAAQWSTVLDERYGPAWMASFARAHAKPMALAMWGEVARTAGGYGDDAEYVTQLLGWAAEQGLQMCVLWDYGSWALTGGGFPAAAAALERAVADTPATATGVLERLPGGTRHGRDWDGSSVRSVLRRRGGGNVRRRKPDR